MTGTAVQAQLSKPPAWVELTWIDTNPGEIGLLDLEVDQRVEPLSSVCDTASRRGPPLPESTLAWPLRRILSW